MLQESRDLPMKHPRLVQLTRLITFIGIIFIFFSYTSDYLSFQTYPEYVQKTLYLDRSFNDSEVENIIAATWEWSDATENRVVFTVKMLPDDHIDLRNAIIVNKLSDETAQVVMLDLFNDKTTLGFYDNKNVIPYIGLITSRLHSRNYKPVVLHELGHALGLGHNDKEEDKGSLMYPIIDDASDHITEKEIKNYCKLHHCKSKH